MTYKELQDIFIELTFLMRGYDYNDLDSDGQRLVKLAYQMQPFQDLVDNISYVWVNYADSSANNQINERMELDGESSKLISNKYQLRNLDVHWTFYGELAQDIAYIFRQKVFSNSSKDFLDKYNIKLIPNVPEVVLFYEEVNKIWWPRVDIVVRYYIETKITEELDYIDTVNVGLRLRTESKEVIIKK